MRNRFPFACTPIGWFAVAHSDELPVGAVTPLAYFGAEQVLFRAEDGTARMLDAHCPHLGAHLGHGGVVEGNLLRCPFHGWSFDREGVCAKIPHASKIPPGAKVRAWPVQERNGLIFAYYHPAREAPTHEVPLVAEHGATGWTPYVRRRWKVRTNVHEMVENAFDAAHFRHLHALRDMPTPEVMFDGPACRMSARAVMNTPAGPASSALDIRKTGLGVGTARFTGFIETLVLTLLTPVDDEHVDMRLCFTMKDVPDEPRAQAAGAAFVNELVRQVEQDIRIWENKAYLERPLLSQGDELISAFRRWARQFYPRLSLSTAPPAPRRCPPGADRPEGEGEVVEDRTGV